MHPIDQAEQAQRDDRFDGPPYPCHWCMKDRPVTPHGWDNICAECMARGERPHIPEPSPYHAPELWTPAQRAKYGASVAGGLSGSKAGDIVTGQQKQAEQLHKSFTMQQRAQPTEEQAKAQQLAGCVDPLSALRNPPPWMDHPKIIDHLFLEIDTALARAKAAEKQAATRGQNNRVLEADNADQIDRRRAAESRLAEAIALLRDWHEHVRNHHPLLWSNTDAFLSATPAQAAEPVADDSETNCCEHGDHPAPEGKRFCSRECAKCEATEHDDGVSECAGICLPVTRSWSDLRDERDEARIALRECRAESQKRLDATNAMREALESARAERDTALEKYQGAVHIAAKALARIAELEAQAKVVDEHLEVAHKRADEREARIARAAAELEKIDISRFENDAPHEARRMRRALEALR